MLCLLRSTILVFLATAPIAQAQEEPKDSFTPPSYQKLRYDEDYRYLADPSRRTDLWDPIKYIRIAPDPSTYLSFGGELRERFEWYSQPNFGLRGSHEDDRYLLHRLLLHADLHVTEYVRVFVQFGDMLQTGKQSPLSQVDVDRLDLQQAFLDLRLPLSPGVAPLLRIGRADLNNPKIEDWEIELKIPQKYIGQVLEAFQRLGKNGGELEVDLLLVSAPTRIFTSCSVSKLLARWWATMPMKPGARPHCGMKAVLAPSAMRLISLVAATSSVRSK